MSQVHLYSSLDKSIRYFLCPRTGLTSRMLFHPWGDFFTPSLPSHLFLPPWLYCLPNFSLRTVAWENHSRQGFWVSQIWRWGDVTWHTEGRGRRWGLQASHSWRLRQLWVPFRSKGRFQWVTQRKASWSWKRNRSKQDTESTARSPARGYEHAERGSTERKRKMCKNHSLFPWQSSKVLYYRKMAHGVSCVPEDEHSAGRQTLSNHRARWTTKRFYKEYMPFTKLKSHQCAGTWDHI